MKQQVVKNEITFKDYKQCLFQGRKQFRKMNVIRSHKHEIYSEQVKVTVTLRGKNFDNFFFILEMSYIKHEVSNPKKNFFKILFCARDIQGNVFIRQVNKGQKCQLQCGFSRFVFFMSYPTLKESSSFRMQ